mmetsp:Transcript_42547/g.105984  ORF Transcript_42547/g.105984 Transcript_42547/m.105984 type:complete len:247 (-) Transcript_42547:1206-1946(-)
MKMRWQRMYASQLAAHPKVILHSCRRSTGFFRHCRLNERDIRYSSDSLLKSRPCHVRGVGSDCDCMSSPRPSWASGGLGGGVGGGSVDVSLAFLHDSCFCFTSRSASLTTHGAQQMMRNKAFAIPIASCGSKKKAKSHAEDVAKTMANVDSASITIGFSPESSGGSYCIASTTISTDAVLKRSMTVCVRVKPTLPECIVGARTECCWRKASLRRAFTWRESWCHDFTKMLFCPVSVACDRRCCQAI